MYVARREAHEQGERRRADGPRGSEPRPHRQLCGKRARHGLGEGLRERKDWATGRGTSIRTQREGRPMLALRPIFFGVVMLLFAGRADGSTVATSVSATSGHTCSSMADGTV